MIRASDGAPLWIFPGRKLETRLVAKTCVYITDPLGRINFVRRSDGKKVASFDAGSQIYAVLWRNGVVYLGGNNVYALDARDGRRLWSYPVAVNKMTIAGDVLYCYTSTGNLLALEV